MGTIYSAYDIRGRLDETFTVEFVWTIGKAFAEWLGEPGVVAIVRSANGDQSVVHALTEGLSLQGRDILDGGEGDESALRSVMGNQKAAGILVSHDDIQATEIITLFDNSGTQLTEAALNEVKELAESGNFLPAPQKGKQLN
jgi:phosphomannomutase